MNSHRRQFLRQPAAFHPRLERLERRDCPSCTVFQKEETLTILGDREANHINIADTREGAISVTCGVGDPHVFTGVRQIDLKTGGGNDEVAASFVNPPDNFQFHADLGAGHDRLSISGFDPQPDPPLLRVSFDILAGVGNDEITATFSCPSDPSFQFRVDLGAGDDRLNVLWDMLPGGIAPPDQRPAPVSFDILAGAGNDRVDINWIHPLDTQPWDMRFCADLGAGDDRLNVLWDMRPGAISFDILAGAGNDEITAGGQCNFPDTFHFRADLGAGDDRLNVLWDMQPGEVAPPDNRPGPVVFDILAGAGHDLVDINWAVSPTLLPGDVNFRADLGAGDDRLNILWDMQPGEQNPPDTRPGEVAPPDMRPGAVSFDILAGAGHDRLDFNLVGPPDLRPWDMRFSADLGAGDDTFLMNLWDLNINGDFVMSVQGGAGDDTVEGFIVGPCNRPADRMAFLFDGAAGDDRIAVRVELDEDSSGALDFRVLGGSGDDDLTLAIDGLLDDPSLLTALLDGGRGHDIARVTRNVRVANCEEVIFLDEPR